MEAVPESARGRWSWPECIELLTVQQTILGFLAEYSSFMIGDSATTCDVAARTKAFHGKAQPEQTPRSTVTQHPCVHWNTTHIVVTSMSAQLGWYVCADSR